MKVLKCFFLVLCLGLLRPSYAFADVTYTSEQHKELQEIVYRLGLLNEEDQKEIQDLKTTMKRQQTLYKKQKIYWITASVLAIVSAGLMGYEVGKYSAR